MRRLDYFNDFVRLNEARLEEKIAAYRPITAEERDMLKKFQGVVSLVWEYNGSGDYKEFREKAMPYLEYGFAKRLKSFIENVDQFAAEKEKAGSTDDVEVRHTEELSRVLEEFKSGRVPDTRKLAELNDMMSKRNRTVDSVAKEKFYNPYKLESARAFFGGGRNMLVNNFEKKEAEEFAQMDLDRSLYTYLNFPVKSLDDFERMMHFVQELSEEPGEKEIPKRKIKIYSEYLNDDNDEYAEFMEALDRYLMDNDRSKLDFVLDGIKKYPELEEANEEAKKEYTTVYRGLGFYSGEGPLGEIKGRKARLEKVREMEKELRYVASTPSRHVAQRFAEMRGHLDAQRRSNFGYIIEYKVDPESIVLDATIFESPYGEGEVLIDATKAEIVGIDTI